jgi:hypothetical protein
MTKNILITIATIAVFTLAYQALVVIPREENEAIVKAQQLKIEQELRAEANKQRNYDSCVAEAYTSYSANWDKQCDIAGKDPDCTLYEAQYKIVEDRHDSAQERCLTLYK